MFYQTGRLPTGMYVNNRNLNVDNPHAEEPTNAAADDNNTNELSPNPSVPKSHFLLNILPKSKKQVAVPFLHCNSEKPPPKEPSTSKKSGAKSKTSSSKTSETSAKAITQNEEDGPSLEEIEREFQSFEKKVKKEISDNQNDDSDATQMPSISGREHDTVQLQSSPPISYNQSTDFTSDTLPLNYQFSPAPNTLQRNYLIPDPMGVDAEIMRLNNSIANLRSKKTGLLQQSKELTTRLHRVLTDVEVIDIQIDEMMYKASALRN
uniref:Uncharacterized protein n=1 Tax=Panagrolaimus davidi TaxID=227884 RepID=A0A914QRP4_9BILA